MGLFSKYNNAEKTLLDFYVLEFQKMGISRPLETAETLLDEAIKLSKEVPISPNAGDLVLAKEKNNEIVHQVLEKKRREGVRDEDIRLWWNLSNLERMMMLKVDEFHRLSLHVKCCQDDSLSAEQATKQVRKFHPIYGNPEDTTHTQGDDRPIPEELKDRINIYIGKRFKNDPEKYKKDIEISSTFNALIRKEIKAGKI